MSNIEDEHGNKTDEHVLDCKNLKAKIKTNDKLNSYVKMTIKCDVKCSLAHQTTYKHLMEPAQKDEFGYGVGKYTLLDSYWARARRIAATYAKFFLEEVEGGDQDLVGRFYWMGLGAYAVKTVCCMFDKWQIKCVTTTLKDISMDTVYEGLAKGNFWLFQDVGSWHYLYLMSGTTTVNPKTGERDGYENNFVPCRDKKHVDMLCEPVQDILKNKFPWGDELDIIGNLGKPKRLPNVLERSMELVHEIETAMVNNQRIEKVQKLQLLQVAELAKHEQGNILQPMIYLDPYTPPSDDVSMAKDNHATKIPPEWKASDAFDEEHVYKKDGDPKAVMQDWLQVMRTFPISLGMPTVKVRLDHHCHDMLLVDGVTDVVNELFSEKKREDEPSEEELTEYPEEGGGIALYDYDERMKWINSAALKCHNLYIKYPKFVINDLQVIAGWQNEADQFEDANAITKIY